MKITKTQRKNLLKLAAYLLKLRPTKKLGFDMDDFECETSCGTVACAAGHAPHAGIPKRFQEGWSDYTDRVFFKMDSTINRRMNWWCFEAYWARYDNTPKGAAYRILYVLKGDLPLECDPNKDNVALYSSLSARRELRKFLRDNSPLL